MPGYNDKVRVYFDTNVYSRPFDDQTLPVIQEETNAFFEIISSAQLNHLILVGSDILDYEVHNILSEKKRTKAKDFVDLCAEHVESTTETLELGKKVQSNCGLRPRDALHVASAILGKAHLSRVTKK